MTGPGYEVSPEALTEAARGIEDVLAQLRSLGVGVGRAEGGRGVSRLAAGTGPVGQAALAEAFASFCSRWEWGVRAVVQTGHAMVAGLDSTAGAYQSVERAVARILFDVAGDPRGDSADASWADVVAPAPDQPWQQTGDSMAETWAATAEDVVENSAPGMVGSALNGENPFQGQLDDLADLHEIVE